MVVCVFEGVVTVDDIIAYFAAIGGAGALSYRKIMDATRGECTLSEAELAHLTGLIKSSGSRGTPGPVAIVTGSSGNDRVVWNYRTMTPRGRRLRTFRSIHAARRWLDGEPLGSPR
ncbi:MAG: hypothetical protein GEV13_02700 [Rhodospirillales bacterium]|nr:hypothetical protein [Rhodospirillales bacterium]